MAYITKVTVTINKPVEKVWEQFMDPENLKHWLTGFVSAEHISGNAGQPGSVSKLKFKERGKLMEVMETVVASIPNHQYTFDMEHSSFQAKTDIRLVSIGSRTEFIQTTQFFPKSLVMKLMMLIMKGAMKKQMEKELISLKYFIETKS
jgi:uncharacterized protein YndB with AHSA1/START domain